MDESGTRPYIGSVAVNSAMFQPDFDYLKDYLYWLNDMVTECVAQEDYARADHYLDVMTEIMERLRYVLRTGDLPKS